MKRTSLFCVPAVAVAALLPWSAAPAAGQGDFLVRAGIAHVAPNSRTTDAGDALAGSGAKVEVDPGTALGLTAAYFVTDRIAVELLASSPFHHRLEGAGSISGIEVGGVRHLPPTLSLQYHLSSPSVPVRAYAGLGVNYTLFFDEEVSNDLKPLFDDIDLDNSWGVAAQLGADYEVTANWLINFDMRWIDIDTTADLSGPAGDATVDVEIDPLVFTLAVGYVF